MVTLTNVFMVAIKDSRVRLVPTVARRLVDYLLEIKLTQHAMLQPANVFMVVIMDMPGQTVHSNVQIGVGCLMNYIHRRAMKLPKNVCMVVYKDTEVSVVHLIVRLIVFNL